jgi:hypothetical protein
VESCFVGDSGGDTYGVALVAIDTQPSSIPISSPSSSPSSTPSSIPSSSPSSVPPTTSLAPTSLAPTATGPFVPFCLVGQQDLGCAEMGTSGLCRNTGDTSKKPCKEGEQEVSRWFNSTHNGVTTVCRHSTACQIPPPGWAAPTSAPTFQNRGTDATGFYLLPNKTVNLADAAIVCRGVDCADRVCTSAQSSAWYDTFTSRTSPICALVAVNTTTFEASVAGAPRDSLCDEHYSGWVAIRNTTACGACITSRVPFPGHPAVHVRARTGNRYPPLTGVSFQTRAPKLTSLHWSECATERYQNFSCSDVCPIDCTFEASRLVHTKNATCYTGMAGYKANWRLTKTELTFSRDATVPSTDGVSCKEQRRKQLAQFDQLNHSGSCPGGGIQDGNEAADTVLRLSFRPADKTAKGELLTIAPNATLCIKEDETTVYCPIITPPEQAIAWCGGVAIVCVAFGVARKRFV